MRATRLAALACSLLALAAVGSGCRPEDAQQRSAREALERRLEGDARYEPGVVRCTGGAAPWFVPEETHVFVCTARLRGSARCDVYRVTGGDGRVTVVREERDTICVLPA